MLIYLGMVEEVLLRLMDYGVGGLIAFVLIRYVITRLDKIDTHIQILASQVEEIKERLFEMMINKHES